jgi:hypothetical protein
LRQEKRRKDGAPAASPRWLISLKTGGWGGGAVKTAPFQSDEEQKQMQPQKQKQKQKQEQEQEQPQVLRLRSPRRPPLRMTARNLALLMTGLG